MTTSQLQSFIEAAPSKAHVKIRHWDTEINDYVETPIDEISFGLILNEDGTSLVAEFIITTELP